MIVSSFEIDRFLWILESVKYTVKRYHAFLNLIWRYYDPALSNNRSQIYLRLDQVCDIGSLICKQNAVKQVKFVLLLTKRLVAIVSPMWRPGSTSFRVSFVIWRHGPVSATRRIVPTPVHATNVENRQNVEGLNARVLEIAATQRKPQ